MLLYQKTIINIWALLCSKLAGYTMQHRHMLSVDCRWYTNMAHNTWRICPQTGVQWGVQTEHEQPLCCRHDSSRLNSDLNGWQLLEVAGSLAQSSACDTVSVIGSSSSSSSSFTSVGVGCISFIRAFFFLVDFFSYTEILYIKLYSKPLIIYIFTCLLTKCSLFRIAWTFECLNSCFFLPFPWTREPLRFFNDDFICKFTTIDNKSDVLSNLARPLRLLVGHIRPHQTCDYLPGLAEMQHRPDRPADTFAIAATRGQFQLLPPVALETKRSLLSFLEVEGIKLSGHSTYSEWRHYYGIMDADRLKTTMTISKAIALMTDKYSVSEWLSLAILSIADIASGTVCNVLCCVIN